MLATIVMVADKAIIFEGEAFRSNKADIDNIPDLTTDADIKKVSVDIYQALQKHEFDIDQAAKSICVSYSATMGSRRLFLT